MRLTHVLTVGVATTVCALPAGSAIERDVSPTQQLEASLAGSMKASTDTSRITQAVEEGNAVAVLERRVLDGVAIPYDIANPKSILVLGVTVSFNMVGGWVRQNGRNVYQKYTCRSITFSNGGSQYKNLSVWAGGAELIKNFVMSVGRVWSVKAPEGGFPATVSIDIGAA